MNGLECNRMQLSNTLQPEVIVRDVDSSLDLVLINPSWLEK